jgi:hypothetical protein
MREETHQMVGPDSMSIVGQAPPGLINLWGVFYAIFVAPRTAVIIALVPTFRVGAARFDASHRRKAAGSIVPTRGRV